MTDKHFTQQEANSLLGTSIRTNREFPGVPVGSKGKITEIYAVSNNRYGITITWELDTKVIDGFSKTEYDLFLFPVGE
jgi:hypothetical protein